MMKKLAKRALITVTVSFQVEGNPAFAKAAKANLLARAKLYLLQETSSNIHWPVKRKKAEVNYYLVRGE